MQQEKNLKGNAQRVGAKRDPIEIASQQWAAVSYVCPEGTRQRSKDCRLKIRGVFPTKEECNDYINQVLYPMDSDFDIFSVALYEWLPMPPPIELLPRIKMQYEDEKLNKIMKGYYERAEKGRIEVHNRMKTAQQDAKEKLRKYKSKKRENNNEQTTNVTADSVEPNPVNNSD